MGDKGRFAVVIGKAALRVWAELPRDIQERLFEDAVGGEESLRQELSFFTTTTHELRIPQTPLPWLDNVRMIPWARQLKADNAARSMEGGDLPRPYKQYIFDPR